MGYREARLIQGLTPRRQGAEGLRRKRLRRREASAIMDVESNTVKMLICGRSRRAARRSFIHSGRPVDTLGESDRKGTLLAVRGGRAGRHSRSAEGSGGRSSERGRRGHSDGGRSDNISLLVFDLVWQTPPGPRD